MDPVHAWHHRASEDGQITKPWYRWTGAQGVHMLSTGLICDRKNLPNRGKFSHLLEISPSPNTSSRIQPRHRISHLSHSQWAWSCPLHYTHLQGDASLHKERYEKAFKHSSRTKIFKVRLDLEYCSGFPLDNLQTFYVHQGLAQPQSQRMLGTTSYPNKGIGTKTSFHKWHLKLNPWVAFLCAAILTPHAESAQN